MKIENINKKINKVHPEVSLLRISHFLHHIKENTLLIKTNKREMLKQVQHGLSLTATKAFTLIELLVVVLIIGILAAVAVPQYQVAVKKTRLATIKNLTRSIADAEEIYYMANGTYTINWEELDVKLPSVKFCTDAGTFNHCYFEWGHCMIQKQDIDRTICTTSDMGYAIYFNYAPQYAGQRRCYSYEGAELSTPQAKACKNDTGANAPSDDIEIGSNYRMWIYQ